MKAYHLLVSKYVEGSDASKEKNSHGKPCSPNKDIIIAIDIEWGKLTCKKNVTCSFVQIN